MEPAFFSVCDSGYLPSTIIALESIRRFYPSHDFLIGGVFDDPARATRICRAFGITAIHLPIERHFRQPHVVDSTVERWSIACFGHFLMYDELARRGYARACYIDGDVLCVNPFDFDTAFPVEGIVSAVYQDGGWINSGVLLYNIEEALKHSFTDKVLRHYAGTGICDHESCTGYCCELGDQELLKITLEREALSWTELGPAYNYFLPWPRALYEQRNARLLGSLDECFFAHMMLKPWMEEAQRVELYPMLADAYARWRPLAGAVLAKLRQVGQ
jgi:lipopolysaccharide biosynthesis glycosyltransferase